MLISASPDFIMTLPLVFLAQHQGRRPIFLLNVLARFFMLLWALAVGCLDVLPINAIVAGPALSVLGGECVFNSMTYALVSDLTEDPLQRAIYFGYMSSVSYVVALSGPAIASVTMSIALWLPFVLGLLLLSFAALTATVIPSLPGRRASSVAGSDDQDIYQSLQSSSHARTHDLTHALPLPRRFFQHVREIIVAIHRRPKNFSLLLFSFVLTSLASSDTKLLAQYISVRYGWTFASAGYLLSGKAVVNFTLLALVIPQLLQESGSGASRNVEGSQVRHARLCLIASIAGALGIAASVKVWILFPALLIYAVGSALPIFTLSLLKSASFSPPSDETTNSESQVFSIVMLSKTIGALLGAPLMAALWVSSISAGGLILGLPYVVSAGCYLVALMVFKSMVIRVP